jgi:hypothetical protein
LSQVVRDLRAVAQHLGKSLRTVQRYRKAGMPRIHGVGYDLSQCEEWLKKARYAGANLRQLEIEAEINHLVELASLELRSALKNLCKAYLKARGQNRERLLDLATKSILRGTLLQLGLSEEGRGGVRFEPS